MTSPAETSVKDQLRRIVDALPDDATLEDFQYNLMVHQAIEEGRRAAREGRVTEQDELERELGLLDE